MRVKTTSTQQQSAMENEKTPHWSQITKETQQQTSDSEDKSSSKTADYLRIKVSYMHYFLG